MVVLGLGGFHVIQRALDDVQEPVVHGLALLPAGNAPRYNLRLTDQPAIPVQGDGNGAGGRVEARISAGVADVGDGLADELDDIDGDEISKALKGANALEARLRVLRQTQARLTRKYGNATEVNGDLGDVEALVEEILEKVEAGRPQNAQDILKMAKELAKQAQKRYREAVKAHAKSVGRGNQNSKRP